MRQTSIRKRNKCKDWYRKMIKLLKRLIIQLQFMTSFPIPIKINYDKIEFAKGIVLSPIVGLYVGLFLILTYFLLNLFQNDLITSIFIVFIWILITGGLHLDGLADTSDGIFSYRTKERILEIMKDSRIGTNGSIGIIVAVIFKFVLVYSIINFDIVRYLLVVPVIARANIVLSGGISSYAREEDGMGKGITEFSGLKQIIIVFLICFVICGIILQFFAIPLIIASVIFCLLFTLFVKSKIGGVTGDIFGAIIEMSEIVVLFTIFIFKSQLIEKLIKF